MLVSAVPMRVVKPFTFVCRVPRFVSAVPMRPCRLLTFPWIAVMLTCCAMPRLVSCWSWIVWRAPSAPPRFGVTMKRSCAHPGNCKPKVRIRQTERINLVRKISTIPHEHHFVNGYNPVNTECDVKVLHGHGCGTNTSWSSNFYSIVYVYARKTLVTYELILS